MVEPLVYVGIDVSKSRLDVAVRPQGKFFSRDNNDAGIAALVQDLLALRPHLVVLEASGGYQVPPGFPVGLVASLPQNDKLGDFCRGLIHRFHHFPSPL